MNTRERERWQLGLYRRGIMIREIDEVLGGWAHNALWRLVPEDRAALKKEHLAAKERRRERGPLQAYWPRHRRWDTRAILNT